MDVILHLHYNWSAILKLCNMKNKFLILGTCLSLVCFSAHTLKAQEVDGADGSTLGTIHNNGEIDAADGSTLGTIQDNGEIDAADGSTLGTAHGVRRRWAAACFFFFFKSTFRH